MATAEQKSKNWKIVGISSMILFFLTAILYGVQIAMKNAIPTWDITGVAASTAKIKFGKKEYSYPMTASTPPFVIGSGRYTLIVQPVVDATNGAVIGASGRLMDTEMQRIEGSVKTVNG
jgi:hypothetical protein